MRKYKQGDMVIIKDDFLTSLEINPVEISGLVKTESQKKYGDYYVPKWGMHLDMIHESGLTTVDELGKMEVHLTDGEYSYLQIFFQSLVDSEYASKITHNNYHYCECDIFLKSNRDGHSIFIKLISGGMKNVIYLAIEIGRFFESKKEEIKKNNENNIELRRRQDNENTEFNNRWNNEQRGDFND